MKIISIEDKDCAKIIIEEIKAGNAVILPTNTAYGLCANALEDKILEKVFEIKKRSFNKPISIFITQEQVSIYLKERNDLNTIFEIPASYERTAIVKPKKNISKYCINDEGNVGIRITPTKFLKDVVNTLGYPITATSANLSSQKAIYNVEELMKLNLNVEIIVDGGILKEDTQTEVVDYTKNPPKILRSKISL